MAQRKTPGECPPPVVAGAMVMASVARAAGVAAIALAGGACLARGGSPEGARGPARAAVALDAGCAVRLSPASFNLAAGGGQRQVARVEIPSGCAWAARSGVAWITVEEDRSGPGGHLALEVAPNQGPDRLGVVGVGDAALVVFQRGSGPTPGHPRLWVRAADLEHLRTFASRDNPMWRGAVEPLIVKAREAHDRQFFPGGVAARPWPDEGNVASESIAERHALLLAFSSLVTPDASRRATDAARARRFLLHVLGEAARGPAPEPFRHARFPVSDRARWSGETWPLVIDWLYPRLSPADRALARRVFLAWAEEQAKYSALFRDRDLANDPRLVADRLALRWFANNWHTAAARNLLMGSLAFDAEDDPPVDPARPPLARGNSLRAYRQEAIKGLLFQQYHLFREGGDASGGVPVEGAFGYGSEATAFLAHGLLALLTAGELDPARWGPQVGLVADRYHRDLAAFYAHVIAPRAEVLPRLEYLGRLHQGAITEQVTWVHMLGSAHVAQLGPLGVAAGLTGDTVLRDRVRWLLTDAAAGGRDKIEARARDGATAAILSFLLFDPRLPPARDFRGELPRTFFAPAQGRLLARTDWSQDAAWFGYTCNWKTIDHQIDLCGSFTFWRRGEWITDPRNGYSDSGIIDSPDYLNAFAVQNLPAAIEGFERVPWARGGQTRYGLGDPSVVMSEGPGFVQVEADATRLHNRTLGVPAREVVHVSRALVWLRGDALVIYDRATTTADDRWKRFWLNLPGTPRIDGRTATLRTKGGQHVRLDAVLPTAAVMREAPWEDDHDLAHPEFMTTHVVVEHPGRPADVRMLHVLQAGERPAAAPVPLGAQSSAAFDGVRVGAAAAFFPRRPPPADPEAVVLDLPADVTLAVVTGLRPALRYDVADGPGGTTLRRSATGAHVVDRGGALTVRAR